MPRQSRSSSGSRSSSAGGYGRSTSSSPNTGYRSQASQQQRPQQPTNTQTSQPPMQTGGMMGGLGSTIVSGMAFGGGSAIAHQVVRSVMGGSGNGNEVRPQGEMTEQNQNQMQNENQSQGQSQSQNKQTPCTDYNFKFVDCLKSNDNNISSCQTFFDDLKSCERSLI